MVLNSRSWSAWPTYTRSRNRIALSMSCLVTCVPCWVVDGQGNLGGGCEVPLTKPGSPHFCGVVLRSWLYFCFVQLGCVHAFLFLSVACVFDGQFGADH